MIQNPQRHFRNHQDCLKGDQCGIQAKFQNVKANADKLTGVNDADDKYQEVAQKRSDCRPLCAADGIGIRGEQGDKSKVHAHICRRTDNGSDQGCDASFFYHVYAANKVDHATESVC